MLYKDLNFKILIKMIEESVLIWMVVKDAAPDIIKAGGNPIEVKKRKRL